MNELHFRAILAGVFFGVWPLLMNKSNLSGNVSSAAFALGALLVVSPLALRGINDIPANVMWSLVIASGVCGGFGLVSFNGMLAKATPQQVGKLFVLMTVVQITIAAMYQVFRDGGLTLSKGAGFATAILTVFLLL